MYLVRRSSATETPPVGNSPKVVVWLCGIFPPQTSETFRSRKCLENLPRVMIRIIKTKIFGRQTKAKGAMFFIRCFLDRGFLWGLSYEGPRAVRL